MRPSPRWDIYSHEGKRTKNGRMEQSKAMEYGSRKVSPDVLKQRARTNTHTHTHTHTHTYIYIYIYIYIYTHTHTHTHKEINTNLLKLAAKERDADTHHFLPQWFTFWLHDLVFPRTSGR